jgi:tRNA threonylcarbamoyladenosine biosynthesis protein TsaB
VRDGDVLALAHESMERGQDQRLMPLILDVMKKAGVEFDALDRIAVTRGPGSFTGIRIGLAAARGLGLATGKPVIGIDRFNIYREQTKTPNKNLLVVINARRKEMFCRFYPARSEAAEPIMVTPEEIAAFLERHSGTVVAGDAPFPGVVVPQENEAVTAAMLASSANADDIEHLPRPLYIRPPDVTMAASKVSRGGA